MNADDLIDPSVVDTDARTLTDWQNPPTVKDLKQDFSDAQSERDYHLAQISEWLDNLNGEGNAAVQTPKGRSAVVPKVIRKQAEWRYASLSDPFLSAHDLFAVTPRGWQDKEAARQNRLLLNYQFNTKLNKTRFIDEYVRTAVDEGTVIVRTGWKYKEGTKLVEEPVMGPQIVMTEAGPQMQMVQVGVREVEKTVVLENHPTAEVCNTRNVTIDPSCQGNVDEAKFVVFSFDTSLAELQEDGDRYTNLDRISVDNNNPLADPDYAVKDNSGFNFTDKPRKKFVAHEYWGYWDIDGTGELKPIVATWVGNTLIRLEESPFQDGLPFVLVQYLPKRKAIYGEPDGALLEDNQKIIGAVTRGMIDIMGRSANGQQGTRKDALDVANQRKFDRGEDYQYNADIDPRMAFHMHTYPEIPNSAGLMLQIQQAEAESLTGVKAFNNGISGESLGETATGIRGALDASSKRELAILRRLADGVVQIGRKFIAMNAVFLDDEEIVRVTDEDFIAIRRDDLAGEFDLKLSVSTAEEDNAKAQDLAFVLQTVGPNTDPMIVYQLMADIAELKKLPETAKRLREFQPQPDPMQQQIQQLEIEKLQWEIAEIQAKVQNLGTDSQLDMAKAQTEQAKAQNLQSDTDLKNLDFIEQESGVHQERELQKQGEQARANIALEAAKARLSPKPTTSGSN